MTEETQTSQAPEGPQQRNKEVYKPKRGKNKPGTDRRFAHRSAKHEDNMYLKAEGIEVPKSLRVSSQHNQINSWNIPYAICWPNLPLFFQKKDQEEKMPVGPIYLGLFLFLVVGSAFVQILQTSQQGGMVEWIQLRATDFVLVSLYIITKIIHKEIN